VCDHEIKSDRTSSSRYPSGGVRTVK